MTILVNKTVGYIAILKEALTERAVKIAFVFGSVAEGKEKAGSDLDLIVIGDIGMRRLSTFFKDAKIGLARRSIHIPTVLMSSKSEYRSMTISLLNFLLLQKFL